MKIAFTICSNNYLAQAKVLGDSIQQHNPEYKFFICLADKISQNIDYKNEIGHPIILADEIGVADFDNLWKKYTIVEFNTCLKPSFFKYFFTQYESIEYIYYLDPDTCVANSLSLIENEFEENDVLLTPHILTPIELDSKEPQENLFLNYGIYNLGFLGLRKSELTFNILNWWEERLLEIGYNRPDQGLFVDQLWINFVPIYFKRVKISLHPGLNMAPWNLHERRLSKDKEIFVVNENFPLIFYHFSQFNRNDFTKISNAYNRQDIEKSKHLKELYVKYGQQLLQNNLRSLSNHKCAYMLMREQYIIDMNRTRHYYKSVINFIFPIKLQKRLFRWIKVAMGHS